MIITENYVKMSNDMKHFQMLKWCISLAFVKKLSGLEFPASWRYRYTLLIHLNFIIFYSQEARFVV